MKVHDLQPSPGAKTPRRRVGRGIAGKGGKTAGRGTKGQGARSKIAPRFEGGQTPLHRRTPKAKGFKNPFRAEIFAVNVGALEKRFSSGTVDVAALHAAGMVPRSMETVKILGEGPLTKKLVVKASAFSASAKEKIEKAGGTAEVVGGRSEAAAG